MRLRDKVTIVSGGGSIGSWMSNGRATSIVFAREGAKVVVVDCSPTSAEETVRMVKGEGGEAIAIAADVVAEEEVQNMVQRAVSEYGRIDVLFNNVGFPWGTDIMNTSEEFQDRTFSVCLKSIFMVSRHVIPEMRRVGGGVIINNASIAAFVHYDSWAYGTAKAGVIKLSKDMAYEYGRENIRVNCVAPGLIDSALGRLTSGGDDKATEIRRKIAQRWVPLGRQGTPWEVAYAVLFLASDEASCCNGTCILVDGGFCAR